jgi:hypothetical protein
MSERVNFQQFTPARSKRASTDELSNRDRHDEYQRVSFMSVEHPSGPGRGEGHSTTVGVVVRTRVRIPNGTGGRVAVGGEGRCVAPPMIAGGADHFRYGARRQC